MLYNLALTATRIHATFLVIYRFVIAIFPIRWASYTCTIKIYKRFAQVCLSFDTIAHFLLYNILVENMLKFTAGINQRSVSIGLLTTGYHRASADILPGTCLHYPIKIVNICGMTGTDLISQSFQPFYSRQAFNKPTFILNEKINKWHDFSPACGAHLKASFALLPYLHLITLS